MDWLSKYTPTDPTDAVLRASRLFNSRDPHWQLPCVFALTDEELTHAVVWDELCVRRLVPLCRSRNRDVLICDLEMLNAMRTRQASVDEFIAASREIWYRESSRDEFQTAIAQLFGIVGHTLHPNGKRPLPYYGVGVTLIAQGEQFLDWVLTIATEEFLSVSQKRTSGVLPCQILNLAGANHYGFRQPKND